MWLGPYRNRFPPRSSSRCLAALCLWLLAAALLPPPAYAQQSDQPFAPPLAPLMPPLASPEARLENIERQLYELQSAQPDSTAESERPPTFDMGGQLQIDYLFIGQDAANRASLGDAEDVFDFRRARLTAGGEAFEVVSYAIGFDFALAGRPSFIDNWIAVGDLPILGNVRVGHFFEPFSLERYTINRYNTFMERSLVDTFAPARNLGLMAHNTIGELEHGTWAVGWFRSDSDVHADDFGDDGGWAVTSRATWLPIYDEAENGRSLMHVGAAYTYRSSARREVRFLSFPEARSGDTVTTGIPPFVDTGTIAAVSDQRFGAEWALVRGPLYMQAEYICSSVDQMGGPRLFFQGAYGFVSYFLTGESRTYDKERGAFDRVYPYENFFRVRTDQGVQTGWGAWEVAARWSFIDLNDANVQGGTLNDVTLELNWHLNPHTRLKWEYIRAQLDRAPVGGSLAHIVGMRFDIDF